MVIQGIVGDNAEYAAGLEYGTSKMPPRPYIRPVVEKNKNLFVDLFKIIFNKL
jgi:HK97 gp10 family phage protein